MMLDAPMSRRSFVGGVAAMGALAASGAAGVPAAHATEGSMVAKNAPGAGLPWSGSGSQRGDWTSTPEDIERLGGCTMPLEELNYRRELYVSSKGEYTCADGTVVPAVYNKMRALIHTYGVGAGNTVLDSSFTNLVKNVTEEQAQAYLDMPRGVDFTPIDLQAKGGRTLDECRKLCDALADAGYLVRSTRNTGMTYHQAAWGEGVGGYILNHPEQHVGKNSDVICQCHRDAGCSIIGTWLAMGGLDDITGSEPFRYVSNYTLEVDLDSCLHCGACSERCPMQAITMDGEHGGQDGYPSVSNLCFRCGQCAYTCPGEARKLVKKAKEDIPEMPQAMLDDYNLKAAYRFEHEMVI